MAQEDVVLGRLHCFAYDVVSIREPLNGPAPAFHGQDWLPGQKSEVGVRIVDRVAKVAYVVTVQDRGKEPAVLTSRWDATFSGHRAGAEWLRDEVLASVAVGFLRRREAWMQAHPEVARVPGMEYGEASHVPRSGPPPLADVAAEFRLARQAGMATRKWVADAYRVSEPTARRYIKAAQAAGLLPGVTGKSGRPRKTETNKEES